MNLFKTALQQHIMALQRCLRAYRDAEATIDVGEFMLEVKGRRRHYTFYPQFVSFKNGHPSYYPRLVDDATGFKGWLPYAFKGWLIGQSKRAFKEACERRGLRAPAMWTAPGADMGSFIIKKDRSSFGLGLKGPFGKHDPRNPDQALGEGEYYEQFVRGRIAKATYWEDRLAAVEVKDMPVVKGDGRQPLRDLMKPILAGLVPDEQWRVSAGCAAYQGLTLDAVPPAGETVMVDFRYSSAAHPIVYANNNACKELAGSAVMQQLVDAGRTLWREIPEALRPATLYVLDVIIDERDQVWLLEMNANPVAHPDVYAPMMETLFGAPGAREAPPSPPESALPDMNAVMQQAPPRPDAPAGNVVSMTAPSRWRIC